MAGGATTLSATIKDFAGNISHPASVSFTIGINQPPVAVDDTAATTAGTHVNVAVLTNDSDPDGNTLTVTSFTQGANGTVTFTANVATYTPAAGFTGDDSFTYTISDGHGGSATATVSVSVNAAAPAIASFNPTNGTVGATVAIQGTAFDPAPGKTIVKFNGVGAVVTSLSQTSIQTAVPLGATTGRITVETPNGTATSTDDFVVQLQQDFALAVSPTAGAVLQGASTSYTVDLTSTGLEPFTGLATLTLAGVPSGVTATLNPSILTGGQRATLTATANATAPVGSTTLTLDATASIDTLPVTRSVGFALAVVPGGRTGPPLQGVKLTLAGQATETDSGGNFQFLDPPAGTQTLGVDTSPVGPGFPIYSVDVNLTSGQATVLPPFEISPPPPAQTFTPIQNSTQDQVVTDPRFPDVSITLPAGVTVTGWDGEVKTKVAIRRLAPDDLPMLPPPGPTRSLYQFHFGTPMGGLPSAPLPVTIPNDQGLAPGDKAEIWYYDAAPIPGIPAAWRMAGLGTVSDDGSKVVSDPGVGITRFCGVCGTTCIIAQTDTTPTLNPDGPTGGDPVDLALGQMIVEKTDLVLPGRIPAVVHRTYNPFDPFGAVAGFELGLGPGWALSVEVVLLEVNTSLRRLVLPGNARFDLIQQPDASFVNSAHPRFAGAVLTDQGGGNHRLRFKDGTIWRFAPSFLAGLSLLAEQADRNGNRLTIEREANGQITRLIEPTSRALAFTYTGGRITEVVDPLGRTVGYGYDSNRRLDTVTDPAGGVTRYTYDTAGRILAITDPRGITYLRNEYDADGRVARQTQADGGVWRFADVFVFAHCPLPGPCFSGRVGTTVVVPKGTPPPTCSPPTASLARLRTRSVKPRASIATQEGR